MSETPALTGDAGRPDRPAPPDQRGTLDVRPLAVRRTVEHTASAVDGTVRRSSALDLLRGTGYPHADVRLERSQAWITLDVAAPWPCPVTDLARTVHARVLAETSRLTGVDVRRLDVVVHALDETQVEASGTAGRRVA